MLFLLYFRAPVACNIWSHSGTPTLISSNMGLRSACAHEEVYTLLMLPFISINKAKYMNLLVFH